MITTALADELSSDADLDAGNDLEYLLGLAGEATQHDGFEDDFERAAWAVAQWCQELQYQPTFGSTTLGSACRKTPSRRTARRRSFASSGRKRDDRE